MSTPEVVLTDHARWQASRRGLDEATVMRVATTPEQVVPVGKGREVRQSRIPFGPQGKMFLVRIVVDVSPIEMRIVTAYRTRKIDKYWRKP